MGMVNCAQCGRSFDTSRSGVTDATIRMGTFLCSDGCLRAYKQQNNLVHPVDAVIGLAGMAIGGAITASKARKNVKAKEETFKRELREQQREEEEAMEGQVEAAKSAARHVIQHEIQCTECGETFVCKLASDGETKTICKNCKTKYLVDNSGLAKRIGLRDMPIGKAEDPKVTEERRCSQCKYYNENRLEAMSYFKRTFCSGIESNWKDACGNKEAASIGCEHNKPFINEINPNGMCRFWEKK